MRYRRLTYRYAVLLRSGGTWPFGDIWQSERLRLLAHAQWRPDADIYETAGTVELVVDLAGVGEDDFEVQVFDDVVVVEGRRQLPSGDDDEVVYHAAAIRQGPFRVELPLPTSVDAEHIEGRYERGLLRVSLPKQADRP